jgi:hypothetical protein
MAIKKSNLILIGLVFLLFPLAVLAKEDFPKLANYYLKYVSPAEYQELAKWDLLVFPAETAYSGEAFFDFYRRIKPNGLLLSYVYPAMVHTGGLHDSVGLSNYVYTNADNNNWWLRCPAGKKIEMWPKVLAINATNSDWQDFKVDFVANKIRLDKWDGVFYDIIDAEIGHYNNNRGIDLNCNGKADDQKEINLKWQTAISELLKKTRLKIGDNKLMIINGNSLLSYQSHINGRMFETFPTPWEGNGSWEASMKKYLRDLPEKNLQPNLYIINSNTKNIGKMDNYQEMRFGLTSALLGNGYFSYDHGDQSHAQLWWYDEYDLRLGKAVSEPYNLLSPNNNEIRPGLWRRDFEKGTVLVNSSGRKQTYVFEKEVFEKINGFQDRKTNNGTKINWIELEPNDGILLKKINTVFLDNSFDNGAFIRVFNKEGRQESNGFFSYLANHPAESQIMFSDIDNDGSYETLVNYNGGISIYKSGEKIIFFQPFEGKFRGDISMAVSDLDGDGNKEIIVGAGAGGGPHVRIFSKDGRPLTGGFFAYDENFRGGVNIAAIDMDGDGTKEIITGAGAGGGPHVRVFSKDGRPLTGGFFAYDENFRGGVAVAAGDVNGDGFREIITAPGKGSLPEVKIFCRDGNLLNKFMAFSENIRDGLKVMSYDISSNGKDEILVSTIKY